MYMYIHVVDHKTMVLHHVKNAQTYIHVAVRSVRSIGLA